MLTYHFKSDILFSVKGILSSSCGGVEAVTTEDLFAEDILVTTNGTANPANAVLVTVAVRESPRHRITGTCTRFLTKSNAFPFWPKEETA